ncbi:MAG: hypothetical protein HC840_09485 [Leptolyngbyaceae cyanobacterium RM2_2_4]|nr:hypothetical protein [Leptolyngbyaceae cyanobacterium SM1_4_3]NJN57035.1 hypothetical protein [Leptolyngbyaceae cyanobacterium SL_5_9]NJO49630.1 hypothetical protein [Leptolyngbyaceae cyanobacterium RM2_2_4]
MAAKHLIKQVADEFGWTQADVQRAVDASQDLVTTRDEVILCMLRYAGPDLKMRNYELGAQKRISSQQREMVKSLIEQLTNVQNFYAAQVVPTLKATIDAQAAYIKDLLKQASGKNQGGGNG